jgi:hypothetical protein
MDPGFCRDDVKRRLWTFYESIKSQSERQLGPFNHDPESSTNPICIVSLDKIIDGMVDIAEGLD